ncbi:MAG: helix-turn-helix transcriptional regulator, partial [Chloroflexi bacterium]|nr:helix-turn-helix transcriptional regulator [Chloroflexota bacterium]
TQEQLGRELGVTGNTLARWERGARSIARQDLLRLALERLEQLPPLDRGSSHCSVEAADTTRCPRLELRPSGARRTAVAGAAFCLCWRLDTRGSRDDLRGR